MKNYLQPGDTLTAVAPAALSSGDGVLIGSLFGVAATDAAEDAEFELVTRGVFELPKTSEQAWTIGAKVYWTGTECTTVATGNTLIGCAAQVAANPSGTGFVRLDGVVAT